MDLNTLDLDRFIPDTRPRFHYEFLPGLNAIIILLIMSTKPYSSTHLSSPIKSVCEDWEYAEIRKIRSSRENTFDKLNINLPIA